MKAEHQFYAHALTPRKYASPVDLMPLRVFLDGLTGLGALSAAAASPDLAAALPDRFQAADFIAVEPAQWPPASGDLLVHEGILPADSPWWPTLAAGAVIVCTGQDSPLDLGVPGAEYAQLDLGAGLSVARLPGPGLDLLRAFTTALASSEDLASRIAALVVACQSQAAWDTEHHLAKMSQAQEHAVSELMALTKSSSWRILGKVPTVRKRVLSALETLKQV
jgi:hypothetical protein